MLLVLQVQSLWCWLWWPTSFTSILISCRAFSGWIHLWCFFHHRRHHHHRDSLLQVCLLKFVCTIFLLTFINRLFLISHNITFQILVSKWEFLQSQSEIAKLISHLLSVASKILRTEDLSIIESQLSAENPFGNDRIVASFQVHETLLYLRAFIEALNITSVSVRSVPVIRLSKRRIHPAATLNEQDCFAIGGSSESKSAAYCMPVGS